MLSPKRKDELRTLIDSAMHSASATLLTSPPPSTRIEQYWRSKTVPATKNTSFNKKKEGLGGNHVQNSRKKKERPQSARPAKHVRSRMVDDQSLDSDVAWSRTLDRSIGYERDIQQSNVSEFRRRAIRHHRQTEDLKNSMRNEKLSLKRSRKAAKMRRLKRSQSDNMCTLLPDDKTNGGLEGRELKSWKILMKQHAKVVSTANVRISSKLEKHVEHRRKYLKKQSKDRFDSATANDGGMSGSQLEWWKRQRHLHDTVVKSAEARIDTVHEKHVLDEWDRLTKRREQESLDFDVNDGGLKGPEKKHWRIMTQRHDDMIKNASNTVNTRLDKHVLEYRESLERKKSKDGQVECGLSGRELKNWKLYQKVHDKIIQTATSKEETKLEPHAVRYRNERIQKSKDRFTNYDISSGGLEGPELKLWRHIKKTHDTVVDGASVRVDVNLPKHVQQEWKRKKLKNVEKWSNYDPDINGGAHGIELEHWKIMHQLHDKLIATATSTVSTNLDKHVKEYQLHLLKKHENKWKEKDNCGLSGRELKWWREQLDIYNNLKNTAVSTMISKKGSNVEGDMELPKHVRHYRQYLMTERKNKMKSRSINDGMLSGPQLEHWKIMTKIHDELINTASKTVDVQHEKHVKRHMNYVKERSLKRWDPSNGFTAGLEGPELHHWHEMTKLHERVVSAAKSQVDCHHVKSVAELVMEKRHFEKWGTVPHTSKKYIKRKKKIKKKKKNESPKLLTIDEYNRALEIASVVQKEIYFDKLEKLDATADNTDGDDEQLPSWNGVRALGSSQKVMNDQDDNDDDETSFTRRRLQNALKRAAKSTSTTRIVKGSPMMLSPPKGRNPPEREFDFGNDHSEYKDKIIDQLLRPLIGATTVVEKAHEK
jgi:hypothetical protein